MTGPRVIDIPQAAKDSGHNGNATWLATVDPDGKLVGLALKRSSNSPAIDAAARDWAENAFFLPGTDKTGAKATGHVEVRLSYARWDEGSPGGGLDDYRCSDLLLEAGWFAAANKGQKSIFWPENAFTSLPGLRALQRGEMQSRDQREASYAKRGKEWRELLDRCRKVPDKQFLELVEDAAFYRSLVESF